MHGKLVLAGLLSSTMLPMILLSLFSQVIIITPIQIADVTKASDIPGNVVNSKYLCITEHRYRKGQFSDTITGTIVNNSTKDISYAQVFVALYDKDDKLITMDSGSVSVSSLPVCF